MLPKFRVWDKVAEDMFTPEVLELDKNGKVTGIFSKGTMFSIEDFELLRSTRLFDKNGKEIFEGDIVKNEINEVGYIEWSKCRFNFCDSVGHFYLFSIGARQPFEILGNIYEHPHLLGEDTQ